MKTPAFLPACAAVAALFTFSATLDAGSTHSPYAGQESRAIKSLSAEDIDDLVNGRGWGLAKAAELNGIPGPKHLLEMRSEISLSADQITAIETVWRKMNQTARALGEEYVSLERDLDEKFASGMISVEELKSLLAAIATTHSALRLAHLSAHLEMMPILTPDQVALYNQLRGYAADNPCNNIPQGHDPTMWKMHHGCN